MESDPMLEEVWRSEDQWFREAGAGVGPRLLELEGKGHGLCQTTQFSNTTSS
jgi:hypothetical protein